jgi:hypothetical protein
MLFGRTAFVILVVKGAKSASRITPLLYYEHYY